MHDMFSRAPEVASADCTTAVLPVGATEQHGPHLPVGTDTLIASAFAEGLARRLDAYLLPPVAIACSMEHRESRATVYLRPETLSAVVRDVADSLDRSGFRRLVVVSGHGGNWVLKPAVREINRTAAIRVLLLQTMTVAAGKLSGVLAHPQGDVHAGEKETSLILHLHPECVGPLPEGSHAGRYPQDFLDYFDIGRLTGEGVWGFPADATAEKGARVLETYLDAALEYIESYERALREAEGGGRSAKKG